MSTQTSPILRGRAHKLGDDVPVDNGLMPVRLAMVHEFNAEKLVPHLLEDLKPGFSGICKQGDILIAGRSFASGKPHVQGFIAVAAMKLGILCESMPYIAYRISASRGVLCNPHCADVTKAVEDGDQIEMNYSTGEFRNLTSGVTRRYPPLDAGILDLMTGGGMHGALRRWKEKRDRDADLEKSVGSRRA
jgi:3-isopropylmalate/(R)-2-methylmalate dehydratase small subunit